MANKAALELMAADNSIDSTDYTPGVALGNDLYNMGNGITRYDTFKGDSLASKLLPIDDDNSGPGGGGGTPAPSSPCAIAQPQNSAYPSALLPSQYCGFQSYGYGAHTVVGGWLQDVFGVNSSRENYFDSDHRVKVKLYNFNYRVYSSIGLKAKFQSKGFLGIWSKEDCDNIALGWDSVIFEDPLVYNAPGPFVPSFPNGGVATVFSQSAENFKFINFSVPAEMTSEISSALVGRFGQTVAPKAIETKMNNLTANSIASITQTLWSYFTNTYAPGQIAFYNNITKGFRLIFPDKEVIALSRFELVYGRTGEADMIFDWQTCQLTYSNTIGGNLTFGDLVKNLYAHSTGAKSFDVKKASVYGAARYHGAWKGVRIVQD